MRGATEGAATEHGAGVQRDGPGQGRGGHTGGVHQAGCCRLAGACMLFCADIVTPARSTTISPFFPEKSLTGRNRQIKFINRVL